MSYWLQVVVATPVHSAIAGPLTYRCELPLRPGTLVRVPLGRREVLGVVWDMAPTLATSCAALPPEGAVPPKGGLSAGLAPTLVASRTALPPEGAAPPAAWQSQFRGRNLHGQGQWELVFSSTGRRTGFAGLQAGRPPRGAAQYAKRQAWGHYIWMRTAWRSTALSVARSIADGVKPNSRASSSAGNCPCALL